MAEPGLRQPAVQPAVGAAVGQLARRAQPAGEQHETSKSCTRGRCQTCVTLVDSLHQDWRCNDLQNPSNSQERTALSSSVLSPTQSVLSSLPSNKLTGRNMEGKKLRRHVLRGAVVVFVTAGYSGKK